MRGRRCAPGLTGTGLFAYSGGPAAPDVGCPGQRDGRAAVLRPDGRRLRRPRHLDERVGHGERRAHARQHHQQRDRTRGPDLAGRRRLHLLLRRRRHDQRSSRRGSRCSTPIRRGRHRLDRVPAEGHGRRSSATRCVFRRSHGQPSTCARWLAATRRSRHWRRRSSRRSSTPTGRWSPTAR